MRLWTIKPTFTRRIVPSYKRWHDSCLRCNVPRRITYLFSLDWTALVCSHRRSILTDDTRTSGHPPYSQLILLFIKFYSSAHTHSGVYPAYWRCLHRHMANMHTHTHTHIIKYGNGVAPSFTIGYTNLWRSGYSFFGRIDPYRYMHIYAYIEKWSHFHAFS